MTTSTVTPLVPNYDYVDGIQSLQLDCWQVAQDHGWHEIHDYTFVEKIALIHSELSEALEEWRDGHGYTETYFGSDGKPEGIPIELADVVIRVLDLAEIYGVDMGRAIATKQAYNRTRPYRHGGKKA